MKRVVLAVALSATLFFAGACKKQQGENEAIRAAIVQHLTSVTNLNMSAMDMDIKSVSVDRNQAQAQVEFRPKTGAPPGAGMQISYSLEKRDGAWVVQKSQPFGGSIAHPAPGQNPHQGMQPGSTSALPNVNDILHPGQGAAPTGLPPGHPPVNPGATSQTPAKSPTP